MKNIFLLIIVLLLAGCAETTITPSSPDQDAASARKDYYRFDPLSEKEKPYTLNLKKANIYLLYHTQQAPWDDPYSKTDTLVTKSVLITDGVYHYNHTVQILEEIKPSTYQISMNLFSKVNEPMLSGNFDIYNYYVDAPDMPFDFTKPSAQINTQDFGTIITINGSDYPTQTIISDTNHTAQSDAYISILGDIAEGKLVTFCFNNLNAIIFPVLGIVEYAVPGKATFNFTGVVNDQTPLWMRFPK